MKREYPEWFIAELTEEKDKEMAKSGELKSTDRVSLTCPECGNIYSIRVGDRICLTMQKPRYGCKVCGEKKRHISRNKTISETRAYPEWFIDDLVHEEDKIKARNGTLMSTLKVDFKCNKGHVYNQLISNHIVMSTKERKSGCPICKKENRIKDIAQNRRNKRHYPEWFINQLVYEEDKERARSSELTSLDSVYFKCDKGHVYKMSVKDHINLTTRTVRHGCKICAFEQREINRKAREANDREYPQWFIDDLAHEEDKEKARSGELTSTAIVEFMCRKGHIYSQVVGNHISMHTKERRSACPQCNHIRSKTELEIDAYIQSLGFTTEHKRLRNKQNSMFEIDIYIPEKNIGIEYNSCFYHKTLPFGDISVEKMYHQKKYIACKELGIKLISIFEPDWKYREEKIKQYLKDILVPVQERIYARECTLEKIDRNTANDMYEKYHLLGSTGVQQVSYGLFYKGSLTASMSFQKGRYTENSEPVWCLTRFVTLSGVCITGGASKLLKAFEREYKPSCLLSYSDNDFFSGGVYSKLGFEDKGVTNSPRYFWWLEGKEMKREICQLRHLSKNYPELYKEAQGYDGNKEDYIMLALGGEKVYRAGHTKWEKKYVW